MTLGSGFESGLIMDLAFWTLAASTLVASAAVVQIRDLFRAALFLVVSFLGVAGMFVLLRAELLAAVQVLIYVGAIAVLLLFGVLMTRDIERGSPGTRLQVPALLIAGLFLATAVFVAVSTEWTLVGAAVEGTGVAPDAAQAVRTEFSRVFANTVPGIGQLLVRDFVLAFEAASVLLLAAVIGALALIREA